MNTSYVSFNQPTRLPLNREVTVTSVYFRPGRSVKGFPKRMEYEGREYTFIESGLRYLIQKGQQLIEIFDMTDGTRDFRLRFDTTMQTWTLICMKESYHVAN